MLSAAHPEFSTGLIYIALPAGFVLLGLLRQRFNAKFASVIIVSAISILGILAHPEFYIFIIITCLLPLIFKMKERNFAYLGSIFAILIVYVLDLILPGKYYTAIEILGFPLLALNILFVGITWGLYLVRLKLAKPLIPKLDFLVEFRTKLFQTKNSTGLCDIGYYYICGSLRIHLMFYYLVSTFNTRNKNSRSRLQRAILSLSNEVGTNRHSWFCICPLVSF